MHMHYKIGVYIMDAALTIFVLAMFLWIYILAWVSSKNDKRHEK
jgi:hypothetical protein